MSEGMTVVCAWIDRHRVAVPAPLVERIAERASVGDEPATDLAALLGVDVPDETRRALCIRRTPGRAARWLIVGERVAVQRIRQGSFKALPRWLEAIGERLPLLGVIEADGAFAFALDAERFGDEGA